MQIKMAKIKIFEVALCYITEGMREKTHIVNGHTS